MEMIQGLELVSGVGAVGLIVGLIEVAKKMGFPKKFAPILAIAIGLLASYGYHFYETHPVYETIVIGLAIGLAAVGAYSGSKNVIEALKR